MTPVPAARCTDCRFTWNSAAMVDGLRLIAGCPRCGGTLWFRDDVGSPAAAASPGDAAVAPHLALGLPRVG